MIQRTLSTEDHRMPVKPLRDLLAIVADDNLVETSLLVKASKGIVTSGEQWSRRGRVIAVGPGRVDKRGNVHPCQAAVGDIVRYGEWKYTDVDIDGQLITIISDQDVIGIETDGVYSAAMRHLDQMAAGDV